MSTSLTQVQQTEFDALVKIEYRSRGFLLRDTVRLRTDVIGNTCQFRKVGQVIANPVGFQNTIAIQDPQFTAYTAQLTKFAAGTGVDSIQDLTVNFDTKRELAFVVAMAIGRRSDQIIINSMNNAVSYQPNVVDFVNGGTNPIPVGGTAAITAETNMTYSKLRTVVSYFDQDAVPIGERYCAMTGSNLRNLLQADQIISRFYTSNDVVVDGTLNYKELLGMNIRVIPDMSEGGLPTITDTNGTAVRQCFAWHKMAIGMAIGQDMRTEVSYLPRETTWFVNGLFYAGAIVVDYRGFFVINCNEAQAGNVNIR